MTDGFRTEKGAHFLPHKGRKWTPLERKFRAGRTLTASTDDLWMQPAPFQPCPPKGRGVVCVFGGGTDYHLLSALPHPQGDEADYR